MPTATTQQTQTPQTDPNALPLAKPKPLPVSGTANAQPQLQLAPGQPSAQTTPGSAPLPSRIDLANQAIESSAKATDPYYQKALRDATSTAAGAGRLGSGMLRTSLGDLARNRALELDTLRSNAITSATNSAIDDAFRTRDQGLAQQQLELSGELGRGNLGIAQQQADTSKTATLGNLELAKQGQALAEKSQADQLQLAQAGQAQQASQFTQSLDFQKKQAEIDAAYKAGTLSLAQRDQALRELSQSQSNELATGQLELARQSQADSLALSKAQLAQQAAQFGASQEQQMALAKLADATANRQIDVSTAQGKNALLVQLAQIMGTSTANIPASFLNGILAALGQTVPTTTTTTPTTRTPTSTTASNTAHTDVPTGPKQQQFVNDPYDSGL